MSTIARTPASREFVPIVEVLRLIPELEELDELRLSILSSAVPDPQREWSKSGTHSTIDRWLVDRVAVDGALAGAEDARQKRTAGLFARYRRAIACFLTGDEAGALLLLLELGEKEEEGGRFERARKFFETVLTLSLPSGDKGVQVVALRRLGRVLRSQGDLAEALACYERSAELARDSGERRAEIAAHIGIGTVRGYQGLWSEAEEACRSALGLLETAAGEHSLERGQVYNNLVVTSTRQGRYHEAEAWAERALSMWCELSSPADEATCYYNLGLLRKRQGRRDRAVEMYRRALSLEIPSAVRAVVATELAQISAEDGRSADAWMWAREAEREAISARSPYVLGHMYVGLGNLARVQRDEDGFVFFEKALEIARRTSLDLLEGEALLAYAIMRREMGELDESRAYLERAVEIFTATGTIHERARALDALAELDEGVTDPWPAAMAE